MIVVTAILRPQNTSKFNINICSSKEQEFLSDFPLTITSQNYGQFKINNL